MIASMKNSESEEFKESPGLFTIFLKVFTDSLKPFLLEQLYKLKIFLGIKLALLKDANR